MKKITFKFIYFLLHPLQCLFEQLSSSIDEGWTSKYVFGIYVSLDRSGTESRFSSRLVFYVRHEQKNIKCQTSTLKPQFASTARWELLISRWRINIFTLFIGFQNISKKDVLERNGCIRFQSTKNIIAYEFLNHCRSHRLHQKYFFLYHITC